MKQRTTLLIVFLTVFLDLLGFGILIPILPFISKEFGASATELGLLMASYSVMQFLFAPVWGRLSDRVGRKPIILLSLAASAIGMAMFALADSLAWLFASRIVAGIASANISTAQAIIADIMPPERRTKGMGLVGAAIGLGFVFGPGMPALFLQGDNYDPLFWTAAAFSAADFLLALFLLPETLNPKGSAVAGKRRFSLEMLRQSLTQQFIPRLLMLSLLYYIAFSMMESTFGYFIEGEFGMDARANSVILFMVGIVMAIVQGGITARVAKRIGDLNVLRLGVAGIAAGLLGLTLSVSPAAMYVSILALAVFAGLASPAMVSLISQYSSDDVQGGMLGLNQSMASLGRIAGPMLGGVCFDRLGAHSPFLAGAVIVAAAYFLIAARRVPETA